MELERRALTQASSSVPPSKSPVWRLIWSFDVPRVVHLFLWRACSNIFPTKAKLFLQNIVADPLCPMCGKEEDSGHVLWSCDAAKAIWAVCPRRIGKSTHAAAVFLTTFALLGDMLDYEDLGLLAMVTYHIWLRRNHYVFKGKVVSPDYLINGVNEALEEFHLA